MYDIVCIIAAAVVFAFVVEVVFLSWIICWCAYTAGGLLRSGR